MIELCYGDLDIDRAYFVRPRVLGKRGYRTVIRKEGHLFQGEERCTSQAKRAERRIRKMVGELAGGEEARD